MHCLSTLFCVLACSSAVLSTPAVKVPAWQRGHNKAHGHIKATATHGSTGKRTMGFYGNWDIYARNFTVTDIPASQLTHIMYSFMNVNSSTGEVYLSDEWADLQYSYPGDDTSANGTNLYGSIKQLYLLKKKNRSLKTMFSIGGWTFSPNIVNALSTSALRTNLACTAVKLMYTLGFDGIDFDYEYVTNSTQAAQVVDLLRMMRKEMTAYSSDRLDTPFLLSVSSPAGPSHYTQLDFQGMDQYLDFWNFMGLDYAGSWDTVAGLSANLLGSHQNQLDVNTSTGIEYYHQNGVALNKINLGCPLYGRSFNNTNGPGTNFTDVGTLGSFGEAGVWNYNHLPVEGFNATVVELPAAGASYSYDPVKKYMISNDTPKIASQKATWVKEKGVGGTFWWEISMDKTGSDSLVDTTVAVYGGTNGLEKSLNHLSYPLSQYENLREGMPNN